MPKSRETGGDGSDRPLRLCMLSGSFVYDSEGSLSRFGDHMQRRHGVRSSTVVYRSENEVHSLERLEETDVLLVFARRLLVAGRELERLRSYCAGGGAVVGVRTASHAFQNWLEFDKEVLGGNYQGHDAAGPTIHVEANPDSKDHPVLRGVSDFDCDSSLHAGALYKNTPIAPGAESLMTGRTEESLEPVAWTYAYPGGGRSFNTSLGDQADFANESFLRLLANAVLWTAGAP